MPNLPSRALTKGEIQDLTKTFGDAVELAVKAGFELICLHMAHGFLLSEFLSPLANRRRDEYGEPENRLRFPWPSGGGPASGARGHHLLPDQRP